MAFIAVYFVSLHTLLGGELNSGSERPAKNRRVQPRMFPWRRLIQQTKTVIW